MNKIDKFLSKIDKKTRLAIEEIVFLIVSNNFSLLDIKKLKGNSHLYRVRVGRIRIIFEHSKSGNFIQNISLRNDNTY